MPSVWFLSERCPRWPFRQPSASAEFEKVAAQACDYPVRSRKVELWAFVLAELCTIVCSLLRMTSRILLGNWDLDDYLFIPIFVSGCDESSYETVHGASLEADADLSGQ